MGAKQDLIDRLGKIPPVIVAVLCEKFDAWIVGSAADPENKAPRDWDVMIPWHEWDGAAGLILALVGADNVRLNAFGGWKLRRDDGVVDIFPGMPQSYLSAAKFKHMFHPRSLSHWKRETGGVLPPPAPGEAPQMPPS